MNQSLLKFLLINFICIHYGPVLLSTNSKKREEIFSQNNKFRWIKLSLLITNYVKSLEEQRFYSDFIVSVNLLLKINWRKFFQKICPVSSQFLIYLEWMNQPRKLYSSFTDLIRVKKNNNGNFRPWILRKHFGPSHTNVKDLLLQSSNF